MRADRIQAAQKVCKTEQPQQAFILGCWWFAMPPPDSAGPPCPHCHAPDTERLPFSGDDPPYPVYSCLDCGYVWRELKRKQSFLVAHRHGETG
jgi:Zn ribbon nucleic-acid-binding protein